MFSTLWLKFCSSAFLFALAGIANNIPTVVWELCEGFLCARQKLKLFEIVFLIFHQACSDRHSTNTLQTQTLYKHSKNTLQTEFLYSAKEF